MTSYRFEARYSKWDGTQQVSELTADDVMKSIADDIMQTGDLNLALRKMFNWGFEKPNGESVPGLRDLMNRVRKEKQAQQQRYDVGSVLDSIQEQLDQIIEMERSGIANRVESGRQRAGRMQRRGTLPGESPEQGTEGTDAEATDNREFGELMQSTAGPGGENPNADLGGTDSDSLNEAEGLQKLLESMAARHEDQLANLPVDPGGMIRALKDYDFMDPMARERFQQLLNQLQQQLMNQMVAGMQQSMGDMTPESLADMRQMLQELNEFLEARASGENPSFEEFMHKWGHYFGPDITSVDELVEQMAKQHQAMQQLLQSMSPEQRAQMSDMMKSLTDDPGFQEQLDRLGENLAPMMDRQDWRSNYRFTGGENLSLEQALRMMERLNDYDKLEQELKDVNNWNDLAKLDDAKIRDLLGNEDEEHLKQLQQIAKVLEEAGYVRQTGKGDYELTPQGVRKIGERALEDIFTHLKKDKAGQHEIQRLGGVGERTDMTKTYEFGDPFLLDLPKTVMNAVQRGGVGSPVRLVPDDFEVYRTEVSSRSSTVLMVDMSRSMFYNGCFTAAKKVALALDSLIRTKYPKDDLHIIGFSYTAHELKAADLPMLDWNEYTYGTNMQHGFQLARQILARNRGTNKQIIIVTDGEPTAHFENGQVQFHYPPLPRTFQETLREVVRCTKEDITINTFMLERSPYMVDFVNDLMKINKGRVFVSTPDQLGEYILVDYVAGKRKWLG